MSARQDRWEATYRDNPATQLPWYSPALDPDLLRALDNFAPPGTRVLDLGTGPGTVARNLARRGYELVASDISQRALDFAEAQAEEVAEAITWFRDDILESCLVGPFDLIHDRGCFHTLPPERASDYVHTVFELLKPGGRLYLKTFSKEEPGDWGPNRYDLETLRDRFVPPFQLEHHESSTYPGTLDHDPRALFLVFSRP